jgi:hypothetical protein
MWIAYGIHIIASKMLFYEGAFSIEGALCIRYYIEVAFCKKVLAP